MSTTPKLSRESRHAFAHRFSANLKRILEEKHLSMAEVGRKMRPGVKNPTSTVFFLLRAKQLPKDEVMETLAKALGVPVEKLHAGELDDYKAAPAKTGTVPRAERSEGLSPLSPPRRAPRRRSPVRHPSHEAHPSHVAYSSSDADLLELVLEAVQSRVASLTAAAPRDFIVKLAHLCREYSASDTRPLDH
jgi:transcriptional regulator with XRE-family HTH domain